MGGLTPWGLEEFGEDKVELDMRAVTCDNCTYPLTALGKLKPKWGPTWWWWECEQCDEVWYTVETFFGHGDLRTWKDYGNDER